MATSVDQTDFLKTALRLPRDLHMRLMALAQERGVSLNTQIVESLEKAIGEPPSVKLVAESRDEIVEHLRKALTKK
jgi:predicted DNA-binding protein